MKSIYFILLLLSIYNESLGQTVANSKKDWPTVLTEIGKEDIEDLYLGCSDCLSKARLKANSLFKQLPLYTALTCLQSKSYTIRYYSFLRVMALDDALAFEQLKQSIFDSTTLAIRGACMTRTSRYNELIASEYKSYISFKSKGQSFTVDGRTYIFTKADKKTAKHRLKELNKLIQLSKLNLET